MNRDRRIQQALRALDDFRRDVSELAADEIDCDELEQRLSSALNEIGREALGESEAERGRVYVAVR
jgi:hypothetical protein